MVAFIDTNVKTFLASGALGIFRRVRWDGSFQLVLAGATDTDGLGVTRAATFAANDPVGVILETKNGTIPMVASGAITQGVKVFAAASGKIAATGTVEVGMAMEAAAADNDEIEVMPKGGITTRAQLSQEALIAYPVVFSRMKVHDAFATDVPAAGAADDLGLVNNTYGTTNPTLETQDHKTATASNFARFQFEVPPEYEAGETITLRVNAGMLTTISDGTATLDAECFRHAAPTVDISATAAQSINSLTAADIDFTITPTNVVVGDILDIRLTTAISDTATGTAVIGQINSVDVLMDIKG